MRRSATTVTTTTLPSRCVCRRHATTFIQALMLDGSVLLVIGACDRHAPKSKSEAMALIRALLHGIGKVEHEITRQDAANLGGGHGL